jgi:transcriptional regulator with XRE-family HTH domain
MEIRVDASEVRRLREGRLWTQEELADRCRLHARTVQRVEAAGVGSAHTIRVIAEALGVDPESLAKDAAAPETEVVEPQSARLEIPWLGVAAAFLWVALASLVYVPTAEPGPMSAAVATLGFACFCVGLWCYDRSRRRAT